MCYLFNKYVRNYCVFLRCQKISGDFAEKRRIKTRIPSPDYRGTRVLYSHAVCDKQIGYGGLIRDLENISYIRYLLCVFLILLTLDQVYHKRLGDGRNLKISLQGHPFSIV